MTDSTLLPCPFCGGKADWGYHDCSHGDYTYCTECGVEVSGTAEMWNRRPPQPVVDDTIGHGTDWRAIYLAEKARADAAEADAKLWRKHKDSFAVLQAMLDAASPLVLNRLKAQEATIEATHD